MLTSKQTRTILKLLVTTLTGMAILAGGVWYLERYNNWRLLAKATSPDNAFTLYHYRYQSDWSHHAPYGQYLFLLPSQSNTYPPDGHVIFAGYCKEPLQATWKGPTLITINCHTDRHHTILTLSQKAYGIAISLRETHDQAISDP